MNIKLTCLISFFCINVVNAWELGPFTRVDEVNPIVTPLANSPFACPLQQKNVQWQIDHTFNPAAVVYKDKIYVIYRSEDDYGQGIGAHTSRLGLAESSDGLHFVRNPTPVMFPQADDQFQHEWPGGCEDPRIVQADDGQFIMTYTQWNHKIAVLAVATSADLVTWKKHGYAFEDSSPRRYCKSGSIVCRQEGDQLIATKIQGKYWMYFGEGFLHIATSDDLIAWQPMLDENNKWKVFVSPRAGYFDSALVEAGPPAVMTKDGIVLLYNGKNSSQGDAKISQGAYSAGQLLFDAQDPTKVLGRSENCFLKPERSYETKGQYQDGTVFIQGLVHFHGKWFLYYGAADSVVGVAVDASDMPVCK